MIKQKGFTLIEALVVIAVLAVLGFVMTDLLSRTLLGGNKTELLNTIKQNGDRALNQMATTIRNSNQVVCVGTFPGSSLNNDTITVTTSGVLTRFRFYLPTSSLNGKISMDNPVLSDPTQTSTLCTDSQLPSAQDITDTNTTTGVSVSNGPGSPSIFTWLQHPGFKDDVSISFYLSPGISAGSGAQNTIGNNNQINFSTSVELR